MSNHIVTLKSLYNKWVTVKKLAEYEKDGSSEAAIRNQIFNAKSRESSKGTIPGNGLAPHIRRIGSKVLINHGGYLSWIDGAGDGAEDNPPKMAAGGVLRNQRKEDVNKIEGGNGSPKKRVGGTGEVAPDVESVVKNRQRAIRLKNGKVGL
ncbi:MAG: hypothetical protein ABJA60_05670 [Nitrosospira sp.]